MSLFLKISLREPCFLVSHQTCVIGGFPLRCSFFVCVWKVREIWTEVTKRVVACKASCIAMTAAWQVSGCSQVGMQKTVEHPYAVTGLKHTYAHVASVTAYYSS